VGELEDDPVVDPAALLLSVLEALLPELPPGSPTPLWTVVCFLLSFWW